MAAQIIIDFAVPAVGALAAFFSYREIKKSRSKTEGVKVTFFLSDDTTYRLDLPIGDREKVEKIIRRILDQEDKDKQAPISWPKTTDSESKDAR